MCVCVCDFVYTRNAVKVYNFVSIRTDYLEEFLHHNLDHVLFLDAVNNAKFSVIYFL